MYALGHLGIGLGLAWLATTRRRDPIDFRLVLLGTVLPDLIDKPLAALLGLEGRLWAHSLLFLVGLALLSRVPSLRPILWLAFGVGTHLVLDQIWWQPVVVLWPAFGPFPPGAPSLEGLLDVLFHDPVVQAGEGIGLAILVGFAWTHGVRSWPSLRAFLRSGTPLPVAAPGDSSDRYDPNHREGIGVAARLRSRRP